MDSSRKTTRGDSDS